MTVQSIMSRLSAQNPFRNFEPLDNPPRPDEFAIPRYLPATEQIPHIQSQLNILTYNHLPQTFFSLEKHRSLQSILGTAKEILTEALPIRCLEATFVGLHLTQCLKDVDRIPLSLKSRVKKNVFRHIVLVIRVKKPLELYGAIGLSRKAGLMYKPMKFKSMYDLIMDYRHEYTLIGHELIDFKLGLAVPHNSLCLMHPCWRFIALRLHGFKSSTPSTLEQEENGRCGNKDSAAEGFAPASSTPQIALSPLDLSTHVATAKLHDHARAETASAREENINTDKGCVGDRISATTSDKPAVCNNTGEDSGDESAHRTDSCASKDESSNDQRDECGFDASQVPSVREHTSSASDTGASNASRSGTSHATRSAETKSIWKGCANAKGVDAVAFCPGVSITVPHGTPETLTTVSAATTPVHTSPKTASEHAPCSLSVFLAKYCKLLYIISEQYYKGLLSAGSSGSSQNRAVRLCYMDLDKAECDCKAENRRRIRYINLMQSPLSIEARAAAAKRPTHGTYLKRTPTLSVSLTAESITDHAQNRPGQNSQATKGNHSSKNWEHEGVANSSAVMTASDRVQSNGTTNDTQSGEPLTCIDVRDRSDDVSATTWSTTITSTTTSSSHPTTTTRQTLATTSSTSCISVPASTKITSAVPVDDAATLSSEHNTDTSRTSSTSQQSMRGGSATRLSSSRKRTRSLKPFRADSSSAHRATHSAVSCSISASRRLPCSSWSSVVRTQHDQSHSLKRERTPAGASMNGQPTPLSINSSAPSCVGVASAGVTTNDTSPRHDRAQSESTTSNTLVSTLTPPSASQSISTSATTHDNGSTCTTKRSSSSGIISSRNRYANIRVNRASSSSMNKTTTSSCSRLSSSQVYGACKIESKRFVSSSRDDRCSSNSKSDRAVMRTGTHTVPQTSILSPHRSTNDSKNNSAASASFRPTENSVLFHVHTTQQ